MKRKFYIDLTLNEPIKTMTGIGNIKKDACLNTYPLEDFFTEEGVREIIAKLYYFLFHYYAYTKIAIDINDISFFVKGELIKSSRLGGRGIELFVIYKNNKIVSIKNLNNPNGKFIENEIDKKIENIKDLSFISLLAINFTKTIKKYTKIFGVKHPINNASKILMPILQDLSKIKANTQFDTELSFMLHPKTAQIIMVLFIAHTVDESRNGLAFFNILNTKEEWMKTLYSSNLYDVKELFSQEDFVNNKNYGTILESLRLDNY